jgi:hypothetical protein
MASLIEAIIFDGDPRTAEVLDGFKTVQLSAGLTMLPLTEDVLKYLDTADSSDEPISLSWILRRKVAALAQRLSADRKVLYVSGETFGGPGTQEAVGWHEGRLFYGPAGTCDLEADREPGYQVVPPGDSAINAGLRAMGVKATPGLDEYETIGLTRHRMTEDWINEQHPGARGL